MSATGAGGLLTFRLAEAGVALPIAVVREVMDRPRVVAVPDSHAYVAGVTMAHGLAVPVYDLCRFEPLWSSPPPGNGTTAASLIICEWGEMLIGLLGRDVDVIDPRAGRAEDGPVPDPEGPDSQVRSGYARGVAHDGRGRVQVLDATRLFASLGVPDPEVPDAGGGGR